MKKIIAIALLALASVSANAAVFLQNGIWYGTVCRAGYYYTIYPVYQAQPVGSSCPVRNAYGQIVAWGSVSNE